ncbi:MAG: NAD(+)/NADH kinase [Thermodesulfobacteriota bacterium]
MRQIGLVLKRGDKEALVLAREICERVIQSGRRVLVEPVLADLADQWHAEVSQKIGDEADLLVVLGGDGTMLRAAALLNAKRTPVMGVNLGRVGYMAEVSPQEAVSTLEAVFAGKAVCVERMLLQVTAPDERPRRVLNEVVVHWGRIARLLELGIKVGDSREIELRADGLIVSTPVGSSAYSYAANGPLVHPDVEGILLTPICPFAGLRRPLLVPPDVEITLLLRTGEELMLTLDGHTIIPVRTGQSIHIRRAVLPMIMMRLTHTDYFDILREKLAFL